MEPEILHRGLEFMDAWMITRLSVRQVDFKQSFVSGHHLRRVY